MGVCEDPGHVDPGGIEAAHRGRDVRPRRQNRVTNQTLRHRRLQEVGPPVGALGLDARRVRGDGLMDPDGHPTHLRQEGTEVDAGLLQADEPAGHPRPVRALHHTART
ncbi:hypothetical protein ABTX85_36735 [Streptomyces sp. NPDC096097]|uniref:hypothetical protein n=1 Tax=Streptomyces sp. NPDC096097 TaxID=3155546 RepID=UPI00331CED69